MPTVGAPAGTFAPGCAAQRGARSAECAKSAVPVVGRVREVCSAGGAINWPWTKTLVTFLPPNISKPSAYASSINALSFESTLRVSRARSAVDVLCEGHELIDKTALSPRLVEYKPEFERGSRFCGCTYRLLGDAVSNCVTTRNSVKTLGCIARQLRAIHSLTQQRTLFKRLPLFFTSCDVCWLGCPRKLGSVLRLDEGYHENGLRSRPA